MVKTRRLAVGAIAVFAATGMALAGCGNGNHSANGNNSANSTTGKGDSGSSRTPEEVVLASSKQLSATTYKMSITADTMTGTMTGNSQIDAANKKFSMDISGSADGSKMSFSMIVIDKDMYMKMDLGALLGGDAGSTSGALGGDTWLHMDTSDTASDSGASGMLGFGKVDQSDPANMSALFGNATDITKVDDHHYRGTVDLSKMAGMGLYSEFTKDSDPTKPAQVDIMLDDQGRPIDVKMVMPGDGKDMTVEIKFSDFGAPVDIKKPDHVTEMGDMSSLFGGQGN